MITFRWYNSYKFIDSENNNFQYDNNLCDLSFSLEMIDIFSYTRVAFFSEYLGVVSSCCVFFLVCISIDKSKYKDKDRHFAN